MKNKRWTALLAASLLTFFAIGCADDDDDPDPPDLMDYSVELAGENETPPVATPARGVMDVELDDNLLSVEGNFSGLVSELFEIAGSPAHIHLGAADEAGPVVFNVNVTPQPNQRSGTFSLEQELTDEEVSDFEANEFYINIHTNAYPGGELRGQLDAEAPEFADIEESWGLSMNTEMQPHQVDSEASGWAWVIVRENNRFVVSGAVSNLSGELMDVEGSAVNIEEGSLGEIGDVVFNMEYEQREENEARFWFQTDLSDEQVDALLDGDYYINLYTEAFEDGELRVQIDDEDENFFEEIWEDLFGDDPDDPEEAPPF